VSVESANQERLNDSQNSSTPSPTQTEPKQPLAQKKVVIGAISPSQVNGPFPMSPVLVSSKDKKGLASQKPNLQVERLNLDAMEVVRSEDDEVNFESDFDPSAVDSEQKVVF
jgi:hypothetical protein